MSDLAPTPSPEPAAAPAPQGTSLYTPAPAADPAPAAVDPVVEAAPAEPAPAEPVVDPAPVVDPPAPQYELKFPDGFQRDDEVISEFTGLATEANLQPEAAQKLVDLYSRAVGKQVEAFNTLQTEWVNELNQDPNFSTPDAKEKSLGTIAKAIDEFGGDAAAVRQAFDLTAAGNNPHLVRFVLNMAKALSEGAPTTPGSPPGNKGKTPGQRLYGS